MQRPLTALRSSTPYPREEARSRSVPWLRIGPHSTCSFKQGGGAAAARSTAHCSIHMPCCTVVLHTAAILVPDHQNTAANHTAAQQLSSSILTKKRGPRSGHPLCRAMAHSMHHVRPSSLLPQLPPRYYSYLPSLLPLPDARLLARSQPFLPLQASLMGLPFLM